MKYLSLFSGIGGFEKGIQQAYEKLSESNSDQCEIHTEQTNGGHLPNNRRYALQKPVCIGYSEIDKYATAIYQKHFPEHKNYGDITKINEEELPDFDLLVGGFPCQSFSIAGKRAGFQDTRGTLFFDIARILRAKKPRLLLLENVKGLLSHDQGRTYATIIATLDELGYDLQWQVLNSKNHGVPQNRERVLIVGHLRGTPRPEVFPFGTINEISNGKKRQVSRGVSVMQSRRDKSDNQSRLSQNGSDRCIRVPEATKKGYAEARPGQSINLSVPNSKTRRGRVSNVAQTLDTGMQQHTLTQQGGVRRLTPKECERLQGFPDNWTEGISDTQRYKCCGNAVTVNVIADVVEKML